ncbi:MAG: hypothetical protein GX780_03160 [Campylobacteraceae bacterium]|nr:hypothetical protein [Campylobacteraceae bacterium]
MVTLLLFFCISLSANMVIANEGIVGERAVFKIEALGNELQKKSGVGVYLIALQSLSKKTMAEALAEYKKQIDDPYVVLFLAKEDKQVNILVSSENVVNMFDKEAVLSTYPWRGTILPLLAIDKKDADKYTAAMLNGYADIVEQVASYHNIELLEAVGSSNKTTLSIIKLIFYSIIVWAVGVYTYRRLKRYAKKF